MNFIFLGDVHGNINRCIEVATYNVDSKIIQIGDLGIGFIPNDILATYLPTNFHFFVGNHDNREKAKELPHCLGDYGEAFKGKFFFVSGANSIDRHHRIEGVSWWPDEELSYKQAEDCLNKWENSKCDILVSHDVPQSFAESYMLIYDTCITRTLLERMIEIRKPKMVIYGHHHRSKHFIFKKIDVHGLGIDETFSLDI